jgi:hypothetical protein
MLKIKKTSRDMRSPQGYMFRLKSSRMCDQSLCNQVFPMFQRNTFPVTYRLQMEQYIPLNNGNLPSDYSASSLLTAVKGKASV